MKNQLIWILCVLVFALSACRKTEKEEISASFVQLSEQGHALCRQGNYMEGLKLLQEANDILATMPPDSIDPNGAVMLLGNLSNLYIRIGLFDEARQINSKAIAIAESGNLERLPELWGMRSNIYEHTNQPDSAYICIRRNIELTKIIQDSIFRSMVRERAIEHLSWFFIENPNFAPDSVRIALATLEHIDAEKGLDDSTTNGGIRTNRFLIGRARVLLGDYSRGISEMEKALELYRQANDTESVDWGLQILAKSYASTGNPKLMDIYTEAADLHDSITMRQRDNLLLGMDFKYRTSLLKDEKTILKKEVEAKRQRIVYISIISFLIIAALVTFIIMRNRGNKHRLELKQQNIDILLAERIALNTRIEELNSFLAENNSETIRSEMLQTILLEKDEEQRFRKNFNDLHPGFIDRLRREYPDLTAGNELLCMLIALNRRNEEIALALGISRESVSTSRYRLRCRFNLPKEIELNDFILSRL